MCKALEIFVFLLAAVIFVNSNEAITSLFFHSAIHPEMSQQYINHLLSITLLCTGKCIRTFIPTLWGPWCEGTHSENLCSHSYIYIKLDPLHAIILYGRTADKDKRQTGLIRSSKDWHWAGDSTSAFPDKQVWAALNSLTVNSGECNLPAFTLL